MKALRTLQLIEAVRITLEEARDHHTNAYVRPYAVVRHRLYQI